MSCTGGRKRDREFFSVGSVVTVVNSWQQAKLSVEGVVIGQPEKVPFKWLPTVKLLTVTLVSRLVVVKN